MPFTIKLNVNNFEYQMVRFGYIAEQIPACFSAELFAKKLSQIISSVSCDNTQLKKSQLLTTIPVTLSTYKNDISRRILALPNPEAYLRVVKLMGENWSEIMKAAYSINSLSPITYIYDYNSMSVEAINSENFRDFKKIKSSFVEGIEKRIQVSLGYKYRLSVDISNFYNSIYSHSISWAICGKKNAKMYMRTKTPIHLKQSYELADRLDAFTRFQKNNETNGILVGPYTSRIFSEIILAEIDRQLIQKKHVFMRYVDDYKFYFRSEAEAQENVPLIEKVLNEFNLNLNTLKTEITRFPFEIISAMGNVYEDALKKDGVFGVLNAASILYSTGEKGAFKYALKFIRGEKLPIDRFNVIFPLLVNIMLLDPKYGKYVIDYLKANKSRIDISRLGDIVNSELESSLKQELQQESLLFLYMIHELRLHISAENVLKILASDNDFSIIITLDIWKHHNKLVNRSRVEATKIRIAIDSLISALIGENYSGSRWLLLYEIEMHELLRKTSYTPVPLSSFFTVLKNNGVSFYLS